MSDIILPINNEPEEDQENRDEKITSNYDATREDEEKFFLMYHMHMSFTEVNALDPEYRRWLMIRFSVQKQMEQERMVQARLAAQLGQQINLGNLRAE